MNHEIGPYVIDFKKKLGEGAYGQVYLGKNKVTNETVAIKTITMKNGLKNQNYISFQKEVDIMSKVDHPNLVKFIASYVTQNFLYVVMEYCDGGTLTEYILKKLTQGGLTRLPECEARNIFKQIINGYKEIYDKKIVHRDLKPANMLMKGNQVKISDFGLGKCLQDPNYDVLSTYVGSPLYMAPQILFQKQYTAKADIWSLGVIFYEILLNKPPWDATTIEQLQNILQKKILEFPESSIVSQEMKNIIKKMIQFEEKDRMSQEELFQLQFFIENKENNQKKRIIIKEIQDNSQELQLASGQIIQQIIKLNSRRYNSLKKKHLSCSPKRKGRKEKIFEEKQLIQPPKKTLNFNEIQNCQNLINNQTLIQEICDWVNYKLNKSSFLRNLAEEVIFLGQNDQDLNVVNIVCFMLTKYQVYILIKTFDRLQKKKLEGTTQRYTEEQWTLFCESQYFKKAFETVKTEYIFRKVYLQNLIEPTEQSVLKLNHSLFNEVKSIFGSKQKFDEVFTKVIQFYFNSQLTSRSKLSKLQINYLQFLLKLKTCANRHIIINFQKINFVQCCKELKNMTEIQLINKILE